MKAEHRIKTDHGAEHRKELRTNALADRMGRFMQGVRQRPKGRTVLYWVVIGALVIGLGLWYLWSQSAKRTNSELWLVAYEGNSKDLEMLLSKDYSEYNQGKIAQYQHNWSFLWDTSAQIKIGAKNAKGQAISKPVSFLAGIANLKSIIKNQNPVEVGEAQKKLFSVLEEDYKALAEKMKDDPMLGAEALYDLAVVQETLAIWDSEKLKAAKTTFQEVHEKYAETAHGFLAKKRLDEVYNAEGLKELKKFYQIFGEDSKLLPDDDGEMGFLP